MSRILITGASGWVGTWLIRDLLRAGHTVIGVDCEKLNKERRRFIGTDFEFHRMDLFTYLFEQMPDVDVVVPLTGQLGSKESIEAPMRSLRDGVTANLFLLNMLAKTGQRPLVVFVSSDLCYREPSRCFYSFHKTVVEEYLRIFHNIYGIPYVILRMGTGYGPLQKRDSVVNFYIRWALEGKTIPVYGAGENRQAFIYIEDAVRCIQLACEGSIRQNRIHPLIGENVRIVDIARAVATKVGGIIEYVEWPELAKKVNVGDLPIDLPFPAGWEPRISLYAGIERTARWMKNEMEKETKSEHQG